MEKVNIYDAWTRERIAEWYKVTEKLRSVINNLDHDVYFCCYSSTEGYMTTKPRRRVNELQNIHK